MNITAENILLIGSVLLFVSIVAGKTSYRFGVPTLLFFLVVGMLAGSEGIGGIYFDDPKLAQFIGVVSLNFILFSGGLDTQWASIKPVLGRGAVLSTLGVLLTATFTGLFVWQVAGFTLYEGLLLGAIVSSTDAAAVFSVLRSKKLGLKDNLRPTLELESGSNDPMAYLLTIALTGLVANQDQPLWILVPMFFKQLLLGGASGLIMGRIGTKVINKINLDFEGLYPVLVIALMFFTFSATDLLGGNGFLAIYLCAVYLGNHEFIHKKSVMRFFDGQAWLMQIVLFLTLGLLVFPSHIVPVLGSGLLISAFLIFVARPLSILISLFPFKMPNRNRLFISWVGLRGAVPIVFATFPLLAGIEKAEMIFNIVFFVSVTSVLIQGTTLTGVARWLKVDLPEDARPRTPIEVLLTEGVKNEMVELELTHSSKGTGKKIVELGFPKTASIAMIVRSGQYITPTGSTLLADKDKLLIFAEDKESLKQVFQCLEVEER